MHILILGAYLLIKGIFSVNFRNSKLQAKIFRNIIPNLNENLTPGTKSKYNQILINSRTAEHRSWLIKTALIQSQFCLYSQKGKIIQANFCLYSLTEAAWVK